MTSAWPALLPAALFAAGTASAQRCSIDTPAPLTVAPSDVRRERLGLRIASMTPAPPGSRLGANMLKLAGVDRLAGPCAALVRGYRFGLYDLSNGLHAEMRGRSVVVSAGDFAVDEETGAPVIPNLLGAGFITTTRVGGMSGAEKFVGIWRIGRAWIVATYTARDPARPREIARSSLPLVGLGYGPSPDTPSGALNLIQHAPDGVRVLRLDWWHPHMTR